MDELENQTIGQWRDSEKKVTTLKSALMQIDPRQRSESVLSLKVTPSIESCVLTSNH